MCRANSNDDTVTKVTLELDLELDLLTKLDLNKKSRPSKFQSGAI